MAGRAIILLLLAVITALAATTVSALAATEHPYKLGCGALARGDVDKAKALFQEAVKLDPSDTDALNNLAVCHMMAGDYRKALPLLQKVLRLNARYRGADLNIGAAYLFQADLKRAEPPTQRATSGGTTAARKQVEAAAYYNLGLIAAGQGDFAAARSAFERSIKVAPAVRAQLGLASSLCAGGDFTAGLPMLEGIKTSDKTAAAALKADLAAAYYQRGIAKLGNGDPAGAEQDFVRSAQAAANDYAMMGQALVVAERGDHAAAAVLLKEITASVKSPVLKQAAQANLDQLNAVADSSSQWLKWLILAGGALLFAFQAYVLVGMLSARRHRNRAVVWMVIAGVVVGVAAAAALLIAFADPFRDPLWVGVALVVDLVVVLVLWTTTRTSPSPRMA